MLDGIKNKILKYIFTIFLISLLILSGCLNYQDINEEYNKENVNDDIDDDKIFCFNYPPFDLEKVAYILPLGCMIGSHVTPIDHQYYVSSSYQCHHLNLLYTLSL